ncbi:hypothetical protein [Jannaschia ovalis]|uniref:Uncharacterized protein n=1 Tax=Jannaschia ovalis TaxID=3038773 RepID=A0ABY8LD41_9RHOB|nr:hypothetical protein [Jannaschia sp. GRR-S6-38]WGH79240.1 hypothetical protein P8627_02960 [Jannaschia sp. GRR-S6-38]
MDDVKDLPAYHWSHGTWFRMPLGYLNPQGPAEMIPILTDPNRFAELLAANAARTGYVAETGCFDPSGLPDYNPGRPFAFWYPSGDYIPFDLGGPAAVTDCPDGDCDPTDPEDRFSVFISTEWGPLPGPDPTPRSSLRMLLDWADRARRGEPQPGEDASFRESAWIEPVSGTDDYAIFDDDGTVITFFHCFHRRIEQGRPGAYCRGWFHDRETGLVAFVVIPFELGQLGTAEYWRGPIGMIREKIAEWSVTYPEQGATEDATEP